MIVANRPNSFCYQYQYINNTIMYLSQLLILILIFKVSSPQKVLGSSLCGTMAPKRRLHPPPAPQWISTVTISRIVTRKSATIYEFHEESKFKVSSALVVRKQCVSRSSSSRLVNIFLLQTSTYFQQKKVVHQNI